MIYKCPNCNGALEYNPITDRMECEFCGEGFILAEIEAAQELKEHTYNQQTGSQQVITDGEVVSGSEKRSAEVEKTVNQGEEPEIDFLANVETMECKIYTCTSCGAELAISETEAATFCAYCGQPTIVFSRVSKELKPQSIVLFRIDKEQAVNGIREKINKSRFVPKEIRNFSVDKVRGIYVPHWVFDIYYYDNQHWECVRDSDTKRVKAYDREAECMFKGLTLDASKNLDDELSQRLEPYDVRTRKPFETGYLSGFYADKYDYDENRMRNYAYWRASQFFDAQVKATIPEPGAKLKLTFPRRKIQNVEYTLLPVWFVTFRYNYENYTIAVNGQTGKIVGTVPYDKKKVRNLFIAIASAVTLLITIMLLLLEPGIKYFMCGFLVLVMPVILCVAIFKMKKIKTAMNITRNYETSEYVKERQDRD